MGGCGPWHSLFIGSSTTQKVHWHRSLERVASRTVPTLANGARVHGHEPPPYRLQARWTYQPAA
jgi:hypothetical protein